VVNFELPNVPEDYVHRIGRTGRADSTGEAVSLVCVDEDKFLRDIEKLIKRDIKKEVLAGFEPDPTIKAEPIILGRNMTLGRGNSGGGGGGGRNASGHKGSSGRPALGAKPKPKNNGNASAKNSSQPGAKTENAPRRRPRPKKVEIKIGNK